MFDNVFGTSYKLDSGEFYNKLVLQLLPLIFSKLTSLVMLNLFYSLVYGYSGLY